MDTFKSRILQIRHDRTHGSSFLLKEIINAFWKQRPDPSEIQWAFDELHKIDPAMVIIHHFLKTMQPTIDSNFYRHLQAYEDTWKNVADRIADNLITHLPGTNLNVLTHSHSGMVIKVLKILNEKGYYLTVWQTESFPGGEGKTQAETLKKYKIAVSLVNDAYVDEALTQTDAVLLGVDHYDQKSFANKTGSKKIVELAGESGCPVYVLGDSRKEVDRVKVNSDGLFERMSFAGNVRMVTE